MAAERCPRCGQWMIELQSADGPLGCDCPRTREGISAAAVGGTLPPPKNRQYMASPEGRMDAAEQVRRSSARLQEYAAHLDGEAARRYAAAEIAYLLAATFRLMPEEMGRALAGRLRPDT